MLSGFYAAMAARNIVSLNYTELHTRNNHTYLSVCRTGLINVAFILSQQIISIRTNNNQEILDIIPSNIGYWLLVIDTTEFVYLWVASKIVHSMCNEIKLSLSSTAT